MGRVTLSSNPARVSNQGDAMPPGTEWTTTDYDDLGRVEHVTTPDNAMTSTSYGGNIVTMVDQANKKRRSETDALGRLVKVTEAPEVTGYGYETTYGYDTLGNLRTVTQDGQTRTFVYDSLKRQTSARIPEGCQQQGGGCAPIPVSYEYNPNGSLKQKTDSRGIQTKFDYDGLGRLKFRSYITPAGMEITPDVTYRYDGAGASSPVANSKGRLTLVTSSISSFSYDAYDVMGRVKAASQTTDFKSYATSYEYDLAGNLQAETYPTGRKITTSFDIAGRVESVTGYASEFRYAPHGALASVKLGNGLWEHTNYNSRLQPVEIGLGTTRNEPSTNSSVLRLVYNYESFDQTGKSLRDNNGNVHSQKISMPGLELTQSYDYDPLNRLKIAQELKGGAEQWKQNYVYDRFGNRRLDAGTTFPNLSQNLDDVRMNPKIDPSTNRLFENQDGNASTKEYSYDVAGNLILDADGRTFIYDAENKQTSFNGGLNFPNVSATYFYDGDGRRVKRETAEGKTVFVYDAMGKLVAEYTNEERRPDEGGTKYLTEDNLGSPRVITDQNKTVVSRHDYAPFGEELTMARTEQYKPDSIRQQFTGQERDKESGLDYFDARYYSSIQGRFTSIDPLAASGNIANPQTWNRYTYVLNNPLRLIDPTGMSPVDQETQQAQSVTQTPPPGEIPRDIPPPVSTVWQVQLVAITQPDVTQAYPPMTNGEGLLRSALGIPNTVTLPGGDVIEDVEVGVGLQQIADEIMLADWQPALAEAKRDYSSRNATGFDEFTQREDQSQSKEFGADIPGGPNAKNSSTFGQGTETKIFGDRAAQKQSIFENRTNAGYHAWRLTQAPISNPSSSLNGQTLSIKEARNFRDRIYQRNRDIAKSYH
jgi:RHS repeat-associated protein